MIKNKWKESTKSFWRKWTKSSRSFAWLPRLALLTISTPVGVVCYLVSTGPFPWTLLILSVQSDLSIISKSLILFLVSDSGQVSVSLPAERLILSRSLVYDDTWLITAHRQEEGRAAGRQRCRCSSSCFYFQDFHIPAVTSRFVFKKFSEQQHIFRWKCYLKLPASEECRRVSASSCCLLLYLLLNHSTSFH